MTKLILAYCIENQMVAAKIASALNGKATIEKVVFDYTVGMETLRKATYSSTAPVLLLISDNFLKSEKCMNDALPLIQSLGAAQRLISVTTEGVYQENGRPVILPTSFDRVSNVIQYMNHWQDRYLDLRRKKPEGDETAFNEKIRVVRTISSEIGELLRYLRSTEYYSYDQFEDSNFIVLYRVLGIAGVAETAASSNAAVNSAANVAAKGSVSHTVFPTEQVAVEELEPANAMADEALATAGNGSYWGAKNGKSEAQSFLDSIMGEENAPKIEHEEIINTAHVSNTEGVDKMKELASNGVVQMKETLVENGIEKSVENGFEKAAHSVANTVENGVADVSEKAADATQVVDNQSPTSDFQIRANQLINEGLDRPTSLEALIAGMREEESNKPQTEISEDLSRQVDAILEVENPTVEATSFGGFTLEQILKDEELRALMNADAEAHEETLATEPVANGIHADALAGARPSNGNGHHVVLDDDDSDLVKKIAAEAESDFEKQTRLKIATETPFKTEKTPIIATETAAEMLAETAEPTAIVVEHFTEKTDAEFRDLLTDTDEETVKSEVSRIFDEAEEPAAHFEFEENINDKLDEKTAALFEEKTDAETPQIIDNQLDSAETENTEGPKMATENVQELLTESMNNSTDNAARYQLAAELAQQSRLTEATEQLEILLETDRKNVEAYVLLAYLAEQQNDYTLSLNSLEKVALLNPDYPGIYYKLGQLTKEHFKKQGRKALRYFQDAVAQDPSNADAQYRLAMMLIEQKGDHATAVEHLTRAVESAPQHDAAAFELAKCYAEMGDQKSAATFYARASELNNGFKSAENDVLFHYEEPQPEPIVAEEPTPTVNDNGMTVMITGATSGIGRATAEVFAKNGYRLILTGRRNDRLEDIKTTFETTYNNRIQTLNFDVRSLEGIKNAVATLEEDFKHVDILINNAGLASGLSPIHEGDVSDWEVMIDTNIKGLLYITRAIAPSMVARKKGHIINLSSIAGKEIYPNGNVYIATKHAVDSLTKAMRVDLHKYGIRVSQVAPGAVEETEFALVRFHGDAEKAKIYDEFTPLKASDVAESIYFIASRADYVNIQDIVLAGTQQAMAAFVDRSGRTDK
jgi:NADP-dependent 3-hydroxy acid dehydrogenase YdfG/Flp pilus assembly protein TadD